MIRTLLHLRHRPGLLTAAAISLIIGVVAAQHMRWTTALLVGWDVGIVVYVVWVLTFMSQGTIASIKRRAQLLDQGKWVVLSMAVLTALASLIAIIAELVMTKGTPAAAYSAVTAGVTVVLSWAFIHCFFAQQYAHDYWLDGYGLDFPGNDAPTYSEFLYFSFTVGMTAQLSDVTTRSAEMRKLVLVHGLLSFVFNTSILASEINLVVGLAR